MDLTALIDTLDTHSGTLIAIATIALVIATVLLVWATMQLANITKNQDKPWLHSYIMLAEDIPYPTDRLYVKTCLTGCPKSNFNDSKTIKKATKKWSCKNIG